MADDVEVTHVPFNPTPLGMFDSPITPIVNVHAAEVVTSTKYVTGL